MSRQGRRPDGVEVAEGLQVLAVGDPHLFGIAAVGDDAGLDGIRADHLVPGLARPARSATPRRVDHDRTQFGVVAGDLVAEYQR